MGLGEIMTLLGEQADKAATMEERIITVEDEMEANVRVDDRVDDKSLDDCKVNAFVRAGLVSKEGVVGGRPGGGRWRL